VNKFEFESKYKIGDKVWVMIGEGLERNFNLSSDDQRFNIFLIRNMFEFCQALAKDADVCSPSFYIGYRNLKIHYAIAEIVKINFSQNGDQVLTYDIKIKMSYQKKSFFSIKNVHFFDEIKSVNAHSLFDSKEECEKYFKEDFYEFIERKFFSEILT
jgi:hypothetical protein